MYILKAQLKELRKGKKELKRKETWAENRGLVTGASKLIQQKIGRKQKKEK